MTASLHNTLFFLSQQVIRCLPAPALRALDAWSHRVARRRALERQRKWQQQKLAAQAGSTAAGAVYHLKPWRD